MAATLDLVKFKPSIRTGKKEDLSDFERGMVNYNDPDALRVSLKQWLFYKIAATANNTF